MYSWFGLPELTVRVLASSSFWKVCIPDKPVLSLDLLLLYPDAGDGCDPIRKIILASSELEYFGRNPDEWDAAPFRVQVYLTEDCLCIRLAGSGTFWPV